MTSLDQLQAQMLAFLRQGTSVEPLLAEVEGIDNKQRLGIYHNAYRARLIEAIEVDHPVLGVYLGDTLFDQMVLAYIDQHPSSFKSLRQFADNLPQFLSSDNYFREIPFVAELARFERLLLTAFDAPEKAAAQANFLQQLTPEQWPATQLKLHPSVQIFDCQWNVVHIWQQMKAEQCPPDPIEGENHWLLWRNRDRLTEFISLDEFGNLLIKQLILGSDLAKVCEELLTELDPEQIASSLASTLDSWLEKGILCSPSNFEPQLI